LPILKDPKNRRTTQFRLATSRTGPSAKGTAPAGLRQTSAIFVPPELEDE
jgi:hypothetical protein